MVNEQELTELAPPRPIPGEQPDWMRMAAKLTDEGEMNQAAQSLLENTRLTRKVPWDVRQELDEILRRPPKQRPAIEQLWKDLKFKQRFGVSRDDFVAYARRVRAVQARAACCQAMRALAQLLVMPIEEAEQLHTAGQLLLLGRMCALLQEEELDPQLLLRLAKMMTRQRSSEVRAEAQRLADRKFLKAARAAFGTKRSIWDDPKELRRRVRMIYGIDMRDIKTQDGPAPQTDDEWEQAWQAEADNPPDQPVAAGGHREEQTWQTQADDPPAGTDPNGSTGAAPAPQEPLLKEKMFRAQNK
jgi:hypothetical protein